MEKIWIHVGTCFPDESSPSGVILVLELDPQTGNLTKESIVQVKEGSNPGWLSRYVDHDDDGCKLVYVAMEDDPGSIQAYTMDGETGFLQPHGPCRSVGGGRHSCYAQLDHTGQWIFTAQYTDGTVSALKLDSAGSSGSETRLYQHLASWRTDISTDLQDRQECPHAHCVIPDPSNQWVLVADLGLSAIVVYKFSPSNSPTSDHQEPLVKTSMFSLPPSFGCRHICWVPNNSITTSSSSSSSNEKAPYLFINNELDCSITLAQFDSKTGELKEVAYKKTLPSNVLPDRAHHRGGSDIIVHPNGQFVYVGCRSSSPGLIAIFKIVYYGDNASESTIQDLVLVGHESTRGDIPRNFKLIQVPPSSNDYYFVVGNQQDKTVVSFHVHQETGRLEYKSQVSTAPHKPCNIASPNAIFA